MGVAGMIPNETLQKMREILATSIARSIVVKSLEEIQQKKTKAS